MKRLAVLIALFAGVLSLLYPAVRKKPRGESRPRFGAPETQYNWRTKEAVLKRGKWKQAWIIHRNSHITADRIFWNRRTEIGRCYDRVRILDTKNKIVITGGVAWHYSKEGRSLVRRNPVLLFKKNNTRVRSKELIRYAKQNLAKAIRDVVITSKRGTARGQLAVYDLKKKTITLTGEPLLEQKSNVHRAEKIVFFQKTKRVELIGRAVLMQGRDRVKADRIVLIDREPKKKKGQGNSSSKTNGKKKKKNRVAYFYGNVRIYRYRKNGRLDSITTGGYGEYFQKRAFARMMASPRMIMASDNTIVHGAVMEQFRDRDLAVVKGNVSIVKKYRTINGQLARYYIKKKKIYLTGNPLITEYGDSYRADVVVFDTAKDTVRWTGQSIAVIGVDDQNKKAKAWRKKFGMLASGASLGRVRRVVGETFLSGTGKPVTNGNIVSWGKLAARRDSLSDKLHLINHRYSGWCDFRVTGAGRFRFKGPGMLALHRLQTSSAKVTAGSNARGATRPGMQPSRNGKGKSKRFVPGQKFDNTATKGGGRQTGRGKRYPVINKAGSGTVKPENRKITGKKTVTSKMVKAARKGLSGKSVAAITVPAAKLSMDSGRLFVAGNLGKQILELPYITITNSAHMLWVNAEEVRLEIVPLVYRKKDRARYRRKGEKGRRSPNKRRQKPGRRRRRSGRRFAGRRGRRLGGQGRIPLRVVFPALRNLTFSRTNDAAVFNKRVRKLLERGIAPERLTIFNREQAELINGKLAIAVSNQRILSASMTNILFSTGGNTNTNASTRSAGRSPAGKQIPGGKGIGKTVTAKSVRKPALFVLTKDFLDTIIRILSGVPSLFKEGVLPSRRSRIGEELDELRKFRYVPFNRRIRKRGKAGEKRMKETGKKNAKQTVRRWNRKRKGNKEK